MIQRARVKLLTVVAVFLLSFVVLLGVGPVSTVHAASPQQVPVSYHYEYTDVFVVWCIGLPGVNRSQYGGYEITDGGNITGNATDDAYFWGYNLVSQGGAYGTITQYAWDRNGNPVPYHINGEYHNITCGLNA